MTRLVLANQATAARRRVYFDCRNATDGITAETGEAAGQPQISTNGGAWTNTGIGTLTAVGNGRYYADLTQAAVATAGDVIETRYKSAATAETPGDTVQVVAFDPDDAAALGLSRVDAAISSRSTFDPAADTVANVTTVATLTGHTAQTGDNFARLGAPAGASVSADVAAVKVDTAAILTDTADIQPKIGTPAADIAADIAAVQSDTDNIQTRLPAALVGGRMDANASAIDNDATAAARLKDGANVLAIVVVGTGSTTTTIKFSTVNGAAPSATDTFYNGRAISFKTGTLANGQATDITGYTGSTTTATVTAMTGAPANGDIAVIS